MSPSDAALRAALGWMRRPAVAVAALTALFLLLPILTVLPTSLSDGPFLVFPPQGLSLRWYRAVVDDPLWTDAALRSLRVAGAGAAIALTAGTLAALGLSRLRRGAALLRAALLAPVVLPGVVYALGFYALLVRVGVDRAEWVIAVGQAVLAMPVVVVVVAAALSRIDPHLTLAARSLGAGPMAVVARVELPLVRRSLLGAAVVAFTLCFDELVIALFLAPPSGETVPAHIWLQAQDNLGPDIAAVAVLLVLSAGALLAAAAWLLRGRAPRPWREAA